jgi:alpha-glucosidase
VEIGPVEGGFTGMLKARGVEIRLPGDWPPASVTVNGVAVKHIGVPGKGGWNFEGNTLTTVIPVASRSVASKVVVEVRRAAGLTARRGELDGFAGTMARVRGAYDNLRATSPVSDAPDVVIDAMQTGDRLSYHPERAVAEVEHLHKILPQAQAAVAAIDAGFAAQLDAYIANDKAHPWLPIPVDYEAEANRRSAAMKKAVALVNDAGK